MLGDEGPKVEHDQLECDRIDDVRDEGDLGVLADRVGDEDGDGGEGVGDEVDSERATNAKSAGQRALQGVHGPDRQRQHDEEHRIGVRTGLVEEDRLGRAERRVHGPTDDDRKARNLQSAPELGAADVKDLREQGRHRLLPHGASGH